STLPLQGRVKETERAAGFDSISPESALAGVERVLERLADFGAVDAVVVARLRPAALDLEIDEHRALLGEDCADLLLEILQIGKFIDGAVTGRAREPGKTDMAAVRGRMAAVGFVG